MRKATSSVTFVSFEDMAAKIPDDRATHYRYRKEGDDRSGPEVRKRKRHKEKGRLFDLDADDDDRDLWPTVRAGSWIVDLYLQRRDAEQQPITDKDGQPDVVPVDFVPGNPSFIVRVDMAGRSAQAEAPQTSSEINLATLEHAHTVIREQRTMLQKVVKRALKGEDQQRKKKKQWRKRAQEAEEGSLIGQLLRGARDNPAGTTKVLKEGAPIIAEVVTEIYDHIQDRRKKGSAKPNDDDVIDVTPSDTKKA